MQSSLMELINFESVGFDLPWHMGRADRLCLLALLAALRPELSIEVGTLFGGSLQVLAHLFESSNIN
jgi:cephalosporin hydroxylase